MTSSDGKWVQRGLKPDPMPSQDLKWEYLEMMSKTGLETSLQHTYKTLAQETSYIHCKSKHIQEAGRETRNGGWYD